jgi:hypothetical protein
MNKITGELLELAFWVSIVALVFWFVWGFNQWEIEQQTKIIPRDAWRGVRP